MYWADQLAGKVLGPQVINDSKTPSGRVHVGSLRGVLVHDAIFRAVRQAGLDAAYYYGADDMDPLDSVPAYLSKEVYEKYIGMPICNIPAPYDDSTKSYAGYFMQEFVDVFRNLGVAAEVYRTSDLYRSGRMNDVIDTMLHNAQKIREIYLRVSGSDKEAEWYPFHVICENCGRIGTTIVRGYDGVSVKYSCEPSLVKWATGCGYTGLVSPHNGTGKLPWKLEWVAKWIVLGVTIEGAGKDHCIVGGSRDIAEAVYREVFGRIPPLNVPYEFVLIGSHKMSSSSGVGISAREAYEALPPEILRMVMLRPDPRSAINFTLDGDTIPRLFDEYDRLAKVYWGQGRHEDLNAPRIFEFAQVHQPPKPHFMPRFSTVATLVQIPSVINVMREFEEEEGRPLSQEEQDELNFREKYAKKWLEKYAPDSAKYTIAEDTPNYIQSLSQGQRRFLAQLAKLIEERFWSGEDLQNMLYSLIKSSGLKSSEGFQAIYLAFLGKPSGPRAGILLSALDTRFVLNRLADVVKYEAPPLVISKPAEEAVDLSSLFHIDRKVKECFPEIHIGFAVIREVSVNVSNASLEQLKPQIIQTILATFENRDLDEDARIAAYRRIYREFGVDPRGRTPSAEALVKRILQGAGLYRINTVVDAYNLTSAELRIPMAAYDLDRLHPPVVLRFAEADEFFWPLGETQPEKLVQGELVYADQERIICRDFNYRDCDLTKITRATRNVILFVDGSEAVTATDLNAAVNLVAQRIILFSGGHLEGYRLTSSQ